MDICTDVKEKKFRGERQVESGAPVRLEFIIQHY